MSNAAVEMMQAVQSNAPPMIYGAMAKVFARIGAVEKDREHTHMKFKFRGIDDLYNEVHKAMAEYSVFSVPTLKKYTQEVRQTQKGGISLHTLLEIEYTFYAEDGSSVTATMLGEAMDNGDKSVNKAFAAADKYCLLQIFKIPTEDEPDPDQEAYQIKQSQLGQAIKELRGARNLDNLYGIFNGTKELKGWKEWAEENAAGEENVQQYVQEAHDTTYKMLREKCTQEIIAVEGMIEAAMNNNELATARKTASEEGFLSEVNDKVKERRKTIAVEASDGDNNT